MKQATSSCKATLIAIALLAALSIAGCVAPGKAAAATGATQMKIYSTAFSQNEPIPAQYTCDGSNQIPPLSFQQTPANAVTLALIVDDPDAPAGTWDHWLLYNIPAQARGVEQGQEPQWPHAVNSAGKTQWHGPCPPDRRHRYFFTLYALDAEMSFAKPPNKKELLAAMQGHVLEKTELVGTYKRTWMKE
jgi:Raf kinase inhibitor-like YbhB/YbcL family protein